MGAEPGEAYVVLGVPPDLDEDGCLELLDGLIEVGVATGTTLAGGDVARAPNLTLAITVVGHAAEPEALVTRSGGAAGRRPGRSPGSSAGPRPACSCSTGRPRSRGSTPTGRRR